ncbi:MAG: hypothetical protein ACLSGB_16205 [Dorea sp.]
MEDLIQISVVIPDGMELRIARVAGNNPLGVIKLLRVCLGCFKSRSNEYGTPLQLTEIEDPTYS